METATFSIFGRHSCFGLYLWFPNLKKVNKQTNKKPLFHKTQTSRQDLLSQNLKELNEIVGKSLLCENKHNKHFWDSLHVARKLICGPELPATMRPHGGHSWALHCLVPCRKLYSAKSKGPTLLSSTSLSLYHLLKKASKQIVPLCIPNLFFL